MTYHEYERLLNVVLDDEIKTAKLDKAPAAALRWLEERRKTGNSGRVPAALRDLLWKVLP